MPYPYLSRVLGKNLAIEYRWAEQRTERFPELAAELVDLKVMLTGFVGNGRVPERLDKALNTGKNCCSRWTFEDRDMLVNILDSYAIDRARRRGRRWVT